MIDINGIVEKIIFRNEENGYTVARFFSEEESITVVGSTIDIRENGHYELRGEFTYHKKFGQQFNFMNIVETIPTTEVGIVNYLSSGLIPHIGDKMAKRIVDMFKEETVDMLENSPQRLLNVEGIGPKKYKKIKEALDRGKNVRKILMYLSNFNISTTIALKIYKEYEEDSINIIKNNPYKLVEDIQGIGFNRADEIAISLGHRKDSNFRIRAGIKYVLFQSTQEGHSYLPLGILLKRSEKLLDIDIENLEDVVKEIAIDKSFYVEKVKEEYRCYYAPYLRAENIVSGKLNRLNIDFNEDIDIENKILEIEDRRNIKLSKSQKEAVKKSIEKGVFIITGGPGTGKTTTLQVLIEVFESLDKKISLCAPTGRAAKRMQEQTGREAYTIHKLLEISFSEEYQIDTVDLETDVLIVDEVSMVDILLMQTLLSSIEVGTRIILVGDADQLPSVGAGNVLFDIIHSKIFNRVNLEEIFRQAGGSMIVKNAHLINEGEAPILNKKDFYMISESGEHKALEIIKDLITKRIPDYFNFQKEDIQVLTPMKKGVLGTLNLNKVLQEYLNMSEEKLVFSDKVFKINDRVMQIKNNYELEAKIKSFNYEEESKGVFNGDMGRIISIDKEEKTLEVIFDESRIVKYDIDSIDELNLSYAMTIHKSQGSEFPVVIIPMFWAPPMLLTRNLIYTAITRAAKLVILVGRYDYLIKMIDNDKRAHRYSGLCEKIIEDSKNEAI